VKADINKKTVAKYSKYFTTAAKEGYGEADTSKIIQNMCGELLGYNFIEDMKLEANAGAKKKMDIVLTASPKTKMIIEVKAATEKLKDIDVAQATNYARTNKIRWAVLTNGADWKMFFIDYKKDDGGFKKVFEMNLCDEAEYESTCNYLEMLHKSKVSEGSLDEYRTKREALSEQSIGKILFCEEVMTSFRREMKYRNPSLNLNASEYAEEIWTLFSKEVKAQIGSAPGRLKKNRKEAVKKASGVVATTKEDSRETATVLKEVSSIHEQAAAADQLSVADGKTV
jgi:predicted type IV restriction endonuclease